MFVGERKEKHKFPAHSKTGTPCIKSRTRTVYIFRCDNCEGEFERHKGTFSVKEMQGRRQYCPTCFDHGVIGKIGREQRNKYMEEHLGRKTIDSMGYVQVYVGNSHPYSEGYCGSVREHILVMENHLGRALEKGEVIHHIDGDKTNNVLDNLDLCTVQEHNACHGASEEIVFELYKRGVVGYDRATKRYYLK